MSSPFDNPQGQFQVLRNHLHQHSLWPAYLACPPGWQAVYGPQHKTLCLDYVEQHWRDLRPRR
ncbi:MbtH family NRPS accessory protein [Pseudomonas vranovensis]|uniref:MbtH family protein n=1 Tax=Pseudomonas vranovensis TaxID=321661 RepID=A0A423DRJ7_9PSED|nr:MbtH family NRPS accessory protein [Pseudomonas vranovensis]ROL74161.1 MbtH family protein [Pseudomonas vranovensis]